MLFLHLLVDAVDMFGAARYLALDASGLKLLSNGGKHISDESFTIQSLFIQQLGDFLVQLRLDEAECQIFQLPFDLPYAQPVSQRRKHIQGFTRHFACQLRTAMTQVMHGLRAPGQLYQHGTDILDHRQQHLAQCLRLLVALLRLQQVGFHIVQLLNLAHFIDPIHQTAHGASEALRQLLMPVRQMLRAGKQQGGSHCSGILTQLHRYRSRTQGVRQQRLSSHRQLGVLIERFSKIQRLTDQQQLFIRILSGKLRQPVGSTCRTDSFCSDGTNNGDHQKHFPKDLLRRKQPKPSPGSNTNTKLD